MTYVSPRIRRLRPDYADELATVLGERVVAVVEIDNLRPAMDTLVITGGRVLGVMYGLVLEEGASVVAVALAEVAGFEVHGRSSRLRLLRTNGVALALGNLEDRDVDLAGLLGEARGQEPEAAPGPASADLEAQLAQLERIASLQASGGLDDEQADAMRRKVIDQ